MCPASIQPFYMSTLMAQCSAIEHTIIFRMAYDHFPQPPNEGRRSPQPLFSSLQHCIAVWLQATDRNVVLYWAWPKLWMPYDRFPQSPDKNARSPFSLSLSLKYCVAVWLQVTEMALLVRGWIKFICTRVQIPLRICTVLQYSL